MPVKNELIEVKDDFWAVKITEGKYDGVVFKYGIVKVLGEDSDGNAILHFDFDVLEDCGYSQEELKSKEFETVLGDLLLSFIFEQLEEKEKNANNRKDDSDKPDPQ